MANYFRLQLHVAGLNLLIRLRPHIADPPALRAWDEYDPDHERVPVKDPTLPVEALANEERRRYQNYRRRKDPLGRGQIETWRTMLIKVAGEVTQSARRILVTIPAHWPHLNGFRHVCQCIAAMNGSAQVPTWPAKIRPRNGGKGVLCAAAAKRVHHAPIAGPPTLSRTPDTHHE